MKSALVITSLLLFTACRREDISVRRVPKDTGPSLSMTAPAGIAAPAAAGHREVDWKVPSGWKELPAGNMRVGSWTVPAEGGPIDVSVIPLSGDAGGDLANVNRWRGQIGLTNVDAAGLGNISRRMAVGPHDALVVEFSSGGDAAKRLLAVIFVQKGTSWFFKAVGPDAPTARMKPDFLRFAASARFHNHD